MRKKKGDPFHYKKMEVIDRLVKPNYNKAMELKMINKLIKKYPLDFLLTVRLHFQVHSLIWFIGGGKKLLEDFYKVFLLRNQLILEKEELKLEDEKIGEDQKKERKKTLISFLNEKKEIRN